LLQSAALVVAGAVFGGIAGFIAGFLFALVIDALVDHRFRRLVLVEKPEESPTISFKADGPDGPRS